MNDGAAPSLPLLRVSPSGLGSTVFTLLERKDKGTIL